MYAVSCEYRHLVQHSSNHRTHCFETRHLFLLLFFPHRRKETTKSNKPFFLTQQQDDISRKMFKSFKFVFTLKVTLITIQDSLTNINVKKQQKKRSLIKAQVIRRHSKYKREHRNCLYLANTIDRISPFHFKGEICDSSSLVISATNRLGGCERLRQVFGVPGNDFSASGGAVDKCYSSITSQIIKKDCFH